MLDSPAENLAVTHQHKIYDGISPDRYANSALGKVVFITGASGEGGIGETAALAFATAGAKIFIVARRAAGLERAKSVIMDAVPNAEVQTHVVDVVRDTDVKDAVKACIDRFGKIDVVISNAGRSPPWSHSSCFDFMIYPSSTLI